MGYDRGRPLCPVGLSGWPDLGSSSAGSTTGASCCWPSTDRPLDVCVDGRRVWTFWTLRDTHRVGPVPGPVRRVAWPQAAAPAPRRPGPDHACATPRPARGLPRPRGGARRSGEGRIEVRNAQGVELGIDKSGQAGADLRRPLRPRHHRAPRRHRVGRRGAAATPASSRSSPTARCWAPSARGRCSATTPTPTSATSAGSPPRSTSPASRSGCSARSPSTAGTPPATAGAAFKVLVSPEPGVHHRPRRLRRLPRRRPALPDGRDRHRRSSATGSTRSGSCELGGRPMPVPARPEKLLEATYGPGWRVPDPAFKFTTPPTHRPGARGLVPRHPARASGTGSGARATARRGGFRDPSPLARKAGEPPRELRRRGARRRRRHAAPTASGWPSRGCR